jgi:K+-transporting ATPase A subunit
MLIRWSSSGRFFPAMALGPIVEHFIMIGG